MTQAKRRILSFILAITLVVTGVAIALPTAAYSAELGASGTLGRSDSTLGRSGVSLGVSAFALNDTVYVSNYQDFRNAINGNTGDITIVLEANITVTDSNTRPSGNVTVDGQGKFALIQNNSYYIYPKADATLHLKGVKLTPNVNSASMNTAFLYVGTTDVTLILEEVTAGATGVLAMSYYYEKYTTLVFRNTHINVGGHNATSPFGNFYNIRFEGESNSITASIPSNSVMTTMFHGVGGTGSKITVADGTQVYINVPTKSVFGIQNETGGNGGYGAADLTIGAGAGLYIEAETLLSTGRGFNNVVLEEGATFSFNQTQKIPQGMISRSPRFYAQYMTMEKDSVFIAHTKEDTNAVIAGIDIRFQITLNSPKYLSIYSPGGAYSYTGSNTIWQMNDIDYIHYWEKESGSANSAAPSQDEDNFAPHYSWTTAHLGRRFTVTADNNQGVRSTSEPSGMPNMAANSNKTGTLEDTLSFNNTAQRLVIGVPLDVDLPSPDPDPETVELIAVPAILHFGTHTLPSATTIYSREVCDSVDENGNMLVKIRDTYSDPVEWELTIEVVETFSTTDGAETMQGSPLVFINDSNKVSLSDTPTPLYTPTQQGNTTDHTLTWGEDEGLLVEVKPGEANDNEYKAVVKWNIQMIP